MTVWTAVGDALFLLAAVPIAYSLAAMLIGQEFFSGPRRSAAAVEPPAPEFTPPISIFKPIRGLDRETYENYASFCRQDYPEFEILFCVSDETDPAVPVIRQIIHDFPERVIRLLVGAEPLGASDKVNKLCRMAREARHEIVIVSDSDVRVEPGFLRAIAQSFRDPAVSGVTCLYRGLTDGSFAADLEALGNSADFAPGVLVAWALGGKKLDFMLGAVMATTKKHLAEIGGFEALVDYFCDDYELGNRLATRGRVELSRFPVDIVYPRETIGAAFRHQIRWNLSIRYSQPWGHFGLIFAQWVPWAALLAACVSWRGGLAYLAIALLLRMAALAVIGYQGMKDRRAMRHFWWLPLRDPFGFVVWLASFFPQRIHWRDRKFLVRDKRLVPSD
jgi:ceramide glucosyltransferase